MSNNILEPNINGYPAVTDWEKVIVVLQQANELLLRGASIKDLSKWIIGGIEIQGSDFYDLPVATTTDPVALPIPTTGNKFGFLADGKFTQPTGGTLEYSAKQWGLTLFDGDKWVKRFTLEMPQTEIANELGSSTNIAISQNIATNISNRVDKNSADITLKTNKIDFDKAFSVTLSENSIQHKDVSDSNAAFGIGTYGWGGPINNRKYLTALEIKISLTVAATKYRIVIKKVNRDGAVLYDKTINQTIGAGGGIMLRHDLETVINNLDETQLWAELYIDSAVQIWRVSPALTYTQALGFPYPRYSSVNDMGATVVQQGNASSYYDVYIITYNKEEYAKFTDKSEQQIIDIANKNLQLPANITNSASVVDNVFTAEFENTGGEFVIFNDSTGQQGSSYYRVGFPVGELGPFKTITPRLYILNSIVPSPTSLMAILRENTKDGAIVAQKQTVQFSGTATGGYYVDFTFDEIVKHSGKMHLEIRGNGKFGIYRRFPNPATIFTEANGYPPFATSSAEATAISNTNNFFDIWFKTDVWEEFYAMRNVKLENEDLNPGVLPNENRKYSLVGSSVLWGDGYLQSGFVGEFIKYRQSKLATAIVAADLTATGVLLDNRKYFGGKALKITGTGKELTFEVTGNEVSIIQSIEGSNINASEIEIYIDDVLHDTINNFNSSPIGSESKNFTGNGVAVMFDLGRCFTNSHVVTVNGVSKVVTQNMVQNAGFSIPAGSDCAIIRKIGIGVDGKPSVTHYLWFKVAPSVGDIISISYNFSETLFYEKTTIGQDATAANESPYGDGDISFDTTAPSSIGSGLDFRQTDSRVVNIYRFLETKKRVVRIKIKGLYPGATGTPYFIFNFATNRYFHFQNAGVGGWSLWQLDKNLSEDYLRGWQRVVEFNPDKIVLECTPNDDWEVKGHKLYKTKNVGITELRAIKNLPLREIVFKSGDNTYDISRWKGVITAIDVDRVTFDGTISTPIVAGDIVMIGNYWSRHNDYIERRISSITGNTVFFDKPIGNNEIIYNNLNDFIGKDIGIRSYSLFTDKLNSVITKIRASVDSDIYLLENPMPNILARELWGYPTVMDQEANTRNRVYSVDYNSLIKWQEKQPKASVVLNVADAVLDPYLNKKVIEFGSNGQNTLATDVILNGVSIYGKRAVVQNGWAYTVDQTKTGAALNKPVNYPTANAQVYNARKPRLVILDESLVSGEITVKYASALWSNDSTHMNANSSKLYADFLTNIN